MDVLKFGDFIVEAKKDKSAIIDLLIKVLKEKPLIKIDSKTMPDEKDAYSLAGLKKYFRENGHTSQDVDDAFYYLHNDKEYKKKYDIGYFGVKNQKSPLNTIYHYIDISKDEANKLKEKIKEESIQKSKPEVEKKAARKKKAVAEKAKEVAKKETAKKSRTIERKNPKKITKKTTK